MGARATRFVVLGALLCATHVVGEEAPGARAFIADLSATDAIAVSNAQRALVALGPDAVPALREAMETNDENLQGRLASILRSIGPGAAAATPDLVAWLHRPPAVRRAALAALAAIGPGAHTAVAKVVPMLNRPAWEDRFAARDALVGIGVACVEPLLRAHRTGSPDVSAIDESVFAGLGAKGDAQTPPMLVRALTDEDAPTRAAAARALGAVGPNATEPARVALERALHDKDPIVRRRSALALGFLRGRGEPALPALLALAQDPHRRAVGEALTALSMIIGDAGPSRFRAAPKLRRALARGRAWLTAHQNASGSIDAADFDARATKMGGSGGAGRPEYTIGVTALATLALLEAPSSDRWFEVAALRFLIGTQTDDGAFGTPGRPKHSMYNHAAAALAMVRAWRVLHDPLYRRGAVRAIRFLEQARTPGGAWGYGVRDGRNDTSVTVWMVDALAQAQRAGIPVAPDAFVDAHRYVVAMTDGASGRTGYSKRGERPARPSALVARFPANASESMTAAGLRVRLFAGVQDRPMFQKGIALLAALPPQPHSSEAGRHDWYYWYHATRALAMAGGAAWRTWSRDAQTTLLGMQRPRGDGAASGSWDPSGPWARDGGRVYTTALALLILNDAAGYTQPMYRRRAVPAELAPAVTYLKRLAKDNDQSEAIRAAATHALAVFGPR